MNDKNKAVLALDAAGAFGSTELSDGICLNSQGHMLAEQEGWDERDPSKAVDFNAAPFWLTSNDGYLAPVENSDDEELQRILAD